MSSLNRQLIIGRLTHDPESKTTSSGRAISNFTVATNEYWTTPEGEKKEEVTYHKVSAFGKLAEKCNAYLKKGRAVYLEGRITTQKWTTKEGQPREATIVVMNTLNILDPKPLSTDSKTVTDNSIDINPQDIAESIEPADPQTIDKYMEKRKQIA